MSTEQITDVVSVEIHFITDTPKEESACLLYDIQTGMWINYDYAGGCYRDKYGDAVYQNRLWRYTHWMYAPKPTQKEDVRPDTITTYDQVALLR